MESLGDIEKTNLIHLREIEKNLILIQERLEIFGKIDNFIKESPIKKIKIKIKKTLDTIKNKPLKNKPKLNVFSNYVVDTSDEE
mgnify:CR=1 FL=1